MKKYLLIITIATLLAAMQGCGVDDNRWEVDKDYPSDYDINYTLGHVWQYDDVNVNGIDVSPYFSFFNSYRLVIHYTDTKISGITFSNGDVPFSVYDFEIPSGKVDAYLNTEVSPYELRIKTGNSSEDEHVIAFMVNGELSVPFQLDCPAIDYKYTFKSVE